MIFRLPDELAGPSGEGLEGRAVRVFHVALLIAALAAGGCNNQRQSTATAAPSPLQNPIDIALYPGARILSTHAFEQSVAAPRVRGSVFAAGSGRYAGQQVIAQSSASFAQLSAWAQALGARPPPPYKPVSEPVQSHAQARQYGFDYAALQRGAGSHASGVMVIVMDPQRVDRQFGSVLGLIAQYRSLPEFMRQPIDDRVKARLGITLSDAMQPESPIGATLGALDDFQRLDARGIIMIEATRR